ncbi:uncharacterized protein LOC132201983 [Neocloeon triangulifer]|uniref:uncharacterized protein LOC132201983 n=1 Tax=Neocloeon triangulifer TaxID=2078957 RepID=UPI00286F6BE8|nr:uncharacterized protein LOC132201983 [Neocloeon triangulifer]
MVAEKVVWPRYVPSEHKPSILSLQGSTVEQAPMMKAAIHMAFRENPPLVHFLLLHGIYTNGGENIHVLIERAYKFLMSKGQFEIVDEPEEVQINPGAEMKTPGLNDRQRAVALSAPTQLHGSVLFGLARINGFRPPAGTIQHKRHWARFLESNFIRPGGAAAHLDLQDVIEADHDPDHEDEGAATINGAAEQNADQHLELPDLENMYPEDQHRGLVMAGNERDELVQHEETDAQLNLQGVEAKSDAERQPDGSHQDPAAGAGQGVAQLVILEGHGDEGAATINGAAEQNADQHLELPDLENMYPEDQHRGLVMAGNERDELVQHEETAAQLNLQGDEATSDAERQPDGSHQDPAAGAGQGVAQLVILEGHGDEGAATINGAAEQNADLHLEPAQVAVNPGVQVQQVEAGHLQGQAIRRAADPSWWLVYKLKGSPGLEKLESSFCQHVDV